MHFCPNVNFEIFSKMNFSKIELIKVFMKKFVRDIYLKVNNNVKTNFACQN